MTSSTTKGCCDGECNHDDCCGKIPENCTSNHSPKSVEDVAERILKITGSSAAMKGVVEVVEHWTKNPSSFEVMLATEWDKKMMGLEYKVLYQQEAPPWLITGEEYKKADWIAEKIPLSQEDFNNKFSTSTK